MRENTNYSSVDIAKFLFSILVVAIHTHPFSYAPVVDYYFTCICRISVPFFFCVSSFFYFSKNQSIGKYIWRILTMYLLWFVLELPLTIERFFLLSDAPMFDKAIEFFNRLILNSSFFISWYLTATWQGMLVVSYCVKRKHYKILAFISLFCMLLALTNSMYFGLVVDTVFERPVCLINSYITPVNSFVVAIPFLYLGFLVYENMDKSIKNIPNSYLIGAILAFIIIGACEVILCKDIYTKTDTYITLIPLTFLLGLLLIRSRFVIKKLLSIWFRKISILIYFTHAIWVYLLTKNNVELGWRLFIIVLALSIIISTVLLMLSKKFKYLKYLC